MVIDLNKCTACQACVIACKAENNIPFVGPEESAMSRDISWMELIAMREGNYPDVKIKFLPRPCFHCDKPPCVKVCPVHATYKNPEGLVAQIYPRCIGCRFCMAACPYTAKYFNWHQYSDVPDVMKKYHNPDVSIRPKGVVEKCTFCHHRLQKAKDKASVEGRSLKPGEYTPACAESCPSKAIVFGDLDNPNSEVAILAKGSRAFRIEEGLGTEPKVFYLTEEDRHVI
jgi:molybdopterin-containing oxidoreductase family iron-sulfur binding subunit